MSINVLLADDHPIVRQGLRRLLEMEADFKVVAEASDGTEALQLLERYRPDVLIVDLMMPSLNGFEVILQAAHRFPTLAMIVLSMHQDSIYVVQALRNGARGYVLKDSSPTELVDAVNEVVAGRRFLSAKIIEKLGDPALLSLDESAGIDAYQILTDRQREVLQLAVEGLTSAEIARRLSISPRTAEAHRAQIMRKLGLSSQAELIRYAIRQGILPLDG
jgi:DNA-binding NarL/FixJ family response regulator